MKKHRKPSEIHSIYAPEKPLADLVFLHGLGGHWKTTWHPEGSSEDYWPLWLGQDLRNLAVWSVEYPAELSKWERHGHGMDLQQRAKDILNCLNTEFQERRPIIFIAHSLGGLIVKQMLFYAENYSSKDQSIYERTIGILFLATPNRGASLANLGKIFPNLIKPTLLTNALQKEARPLLELSDWFRTKTKHIKILSYYETDPVSLNNKFFGGFFSRRVEIYVVSESSADHQIDPESHLPLDGDHFTICKPVTRSDSRYIKFSHFVKKVAGTTTSEPRQVVTSDNNENTNIERRYLRWVMEGCKQLGWIDHVNRKGWDNEIPVKLSATYTPLRIEGGVNVGGLVSVSPIEILIDKKRVGLTGLQGSGKTAFCNYLCLCMAGHILGNQDYNLKELTQPYPNKDGSTDYAKKQQWNHNPLIPVRISLKDFSPPSLQDREFDKNKIKGDSQAIKKLIRNSLSVKFEEYYSTIEQKMHDGKVLVLFDGLDEIMTEKSRLFAVLCILDFVSEFNRSFVIITSRSYAYEDRLWRTGDFYKVELAPFDSGQIKYFIDKFYANCTAYDSNDQNVMTTKLKTEVEKNRLYDIVKRPLLLTLTTYLHSQKLVLPEQRAQLYEKIVELLIDKWESIRNKQDVIDPILRKQDSIKNLFQIDSLTLRLVLERLAFKAHKRKKHDTAAGDISECDLILGLEYVKNEGIQEEYTALATSDLTNLLRDRIGILHQQTTEDDDEIVTYAFPHSSIREYLAASYLLREEKKLFIEHRDLFGDATYLSDSWQSLACRLIHQDAKRWREVVLLAASIQAQSKIPYTWTLVDLLTQDNCQNADIESNMAWEVLIASEIVTSELKWSGSSIFPYHRIIQQLRKQLPVGLKSCDLELDDRFVIGANFNLLGDTRKEIMKIDEMQFCFVSKGLFAFRCMNKPEFEDVTAIDIEKNYNIRHDYWLARYPVSVAQYKMFVSETHYSETHPEVLDGRQNTAIVLISKKEVHDFCKWLTNRWQNNGFLPRGFIATLPSEPEWEKGARGGELIPFQDKKIITPIKDLVPVSDIKVDAEQEYQNNPFPLRNYPWGNEVTSENQMNCLDYGKKLNSALGIFPQGASPYGIEEMSGTVLEWTRSRNLRKIYPADDENNLKELNDRENACNEIELEGVIKFCVRGGSFQYVKGLNLCTQDHLSFTTHEKYINLGFRIAITPFPFLN